MEWSSQGTGAEPTIMAGIDLGLLPWLALRLEARVWPHLDAEPLNASPSVSVALVERVFWPASSALSVVLHV